MRVLFVSARVDYTSTTSYTRDLATALSRLGYDIHLCTLGGKLYHEFKALGIEAYRIRFNWFSARRLQQLLRDFDPQLIHVQNLRSLPLALRVARRLRKPLMVTVHRRPGPDAPWIDRRLVSGVIVVNEVIRAALVNQQLFPKGQIRVIKRGVDLSALRPEPPEPVRPGRQCVPVVGCVGRLTYAKGQHTLISAARRVLDGGLDVHFAIVGEGPEEPRLRALVRKLRLESHVTFSPHIHSPRELYRLFDVVAMPVLSSGVGATALEAMAMGKPVIASAVGELLHVVQDGRTGVLVPEGDAGVLADRIVELVSQPDLLSGLGRQGRAWVEENFALEPMVEGTSEFYHEVLTRLREGSFGIRPVGRRPR